jgi:WXXGXW repeat (2 copies)
MAMFLD